MSYGFQASNSSNILQIDDNYSNFAIYSEGYWAASTYPKQLTLPNIQGVRLLVELPQNSEVKFEGNSTVPNGTCTITCSSALNFKVVVPSSYYTASAYGYGMNIYKADGLLAFSTNLNYIPALAPIFFTNLPSSNYHVVTIPTSLNPIFIDITAAYPIGHFTVSYEGGLYRDEDFTITLIRFNNTLTLFTEAYSINLDILSGLAYGSAVADTGDRNFLLFEAL
jgi:hypothetical protein